MTNHSISVAELSSSDIDSHVGDLCRILADSVAEGAAIGFMATLTDAEAENFWRKDVREAVDTGGRRLFGAFVDKRLVGTVQLLLHMPPNQPHRAEISKMVVHPESRRLGLGKALMKTALKAAQHAGKTLVTLDTRTGDVSQSLYRSVGFQDAGVIPDFALDPDGRSQHATTYMYRHL